MEGYKKYWLSSCPDCGKQAFLERYDDTYVKCEKCENLYSNVLVKNKTAYDRAE